MLVTLKEILQEADRVGYAVPSFNINNLEILQSVVAAAITSRSPLIVQTSEGAIEYAGMPYLVAMVRVAAEADIPLALHLDHGKNMNVITSAIDSGYTSVMFDGSLLPFSDNVTQTKEVVAMAHAKGVSVEAELGAIKGMEDLVNVEERQAFMTDPEQASTFVHETGCDALAVSIGTAHGAYKFKDSAPLLALDRLSAIDQLVAVPLVLHGASGINDELIAKTKGSCETIGDCARLSGAIGVPDAMVAEAVRRGIRKVNIDTDIRIAWTAGVRGSLLAQPKEIDPRKLLALSKILMTEVARHKMELLGSAGKA